MDEFGDAAAIKSDRPEVADFLVGVGEIFSRSTVRHQNDTKTTPLVQFC